MIGQIFQFASTLLGYFKERTEASHKLKMAQMENDTRLLQSETEANSRWEIASITNNDKWIRWASFIIVMSPLIAGFLSPTWGKYVQNTWALLPQWQADMIRAICCGVFGYRPASNFIGSITQAITAGRQKQPIYQIPTPPDNMPDIPAPKQTK